MVEVEEALLERSAAVKEPEAAEMMVATTEMAGDEL